MPDTASIHNDTECILTWTNSFGDQVTLAPGERREEINETTDHWTVTESENSLEVPPVEGWTGTWMLSCGLVEITVTSAAVAPIRMYRGIQRRP